MNMRWKEKLTPVISLVAGLSVCLGVVAAVAAGERAEPENPLDGIAAGRSHMMVAATPAMAVNEGAILGLAAPIGHAMEEETGQGGQQAEDEGDGTSAADSSAPGGDEAEGEDKGSGLSDDDTVYFTTTIKDGQTVTTRDYAFSITHCIPELTLEKLTVEVNRTVIPQFIGRVPLSEGKNTIRITAAYRSPAGEAITASKSYTVHCNTRDIVITTTLPTGQVTVARCAFEASAALGDEDVPVRVYHEDTQLAPSGGQYVATLAEGENHFTVIAEAKGKKAEESYVVDFYDPTVRIITSLVDGQEVESEEFTFTAALERGTPSARLSVSFNTKAITSQGVDGRYTVKLQSGANTVALRARDGAVDFLQTYTIRLKRPVIDPGNAGPETPGFDKIPTLVTNLDGVGELSTPEFTLEATPKNYKGEPLYESHLKVVHNGNALQRFGSGFPITYNLASSLGANTVEITAVDDEGYGAIYRYSYNYVVREESIGTVTISVEAGTVGLGTLIAPTTIELYQADTTPAILSRLFEANGMSPSYNGYLSRIGREGLAANAAIPDDLMEWLLNDNLKLNEAPHDANSLGEFDFTEGSGWMYSVNGHYPGHGFGEYNLQPNDVMRIRFTVAYGKDIGGYGTLGTGYGAIDGNYDGEW